MGLCVIGRDICGADWPEVGCLRRVGAGCGGLCPFG